MAERANFSSLSEMLLLQKKFSETALNFFCSVQNRRSSMLLLRRRSVHLLRRSSVILLRRSSKKKICASSHRQEALYWVYARHAPAVALINVSTHGERIHSIEYASAGEVAKATSH
jgi:hypothetical protein